MNSNAFASTFWYPGVWPKVLAVVMDAGISAVEVLVVVGVTWLLVRVVRAAWTGT